MTSDPSATRAEQLVELRRWPEAESLLRDLLTVTPDDAHLHGLLAQALLGRGDLSGALAAGNRVVALEPGDEWGHRICALVLDRMGRHDEAAAAAGQAVRLAPLEWRTHQAYAVTAIDARGQLPEARRAAVRAVELAPNEPEAHFTVGLVAHAQSDHELARTAYQRTLALAPNHPQALNNLTVLDGHRDLARAARGYGSSLGESPGLTIAQDNVAGLAAVFVRRIYYAGLVAFLVGFAVARGSGGVTSWTVAIAVLLVAGTAAYTVRLGRAVPLGVRRFVLVRMRSDAYLIANQLLAAAMVVGALVVCVVPHGDELAGVLLRPIGLANVAMFAWSAARRAA